MRMLLKARLRFRSLFRRSAAESELENELRFHIDQLASVDGFHRSIPFVSARTCGFGRRVGIYKKGLPAKVSLSAILSERASFNSILTALADTEHAAAADVRPAGEDGRNHRWDCASYPISPSPAATSC
jgi:hypothetical protein